jgi:hypothetical protein
MNPTNDAAILRVPGNISIITDTLDDCVRSYFGSEYVGRIKYRMTEYRSTDMVTCQTYLDAMFTAQCIMEMAKAGWAGANIWDIKNGPDPSTNVDLGYITTDDQPRPTYYVFPYLTKYMGRQMVDASSSDSLIRVYASKDGAGNLTLFVVNNSPDSNYDVQVNISGFTAGTAGTKWQMEPAGKTPGNAATPIQERTGMMINGNIQPDPLALDHISPVSVDVGQSFTLNLPGSAMVLLTIPNGK